VAEENNERVAPLFKKQATTYALHEIVSIERIEHLLRALHKIINIPIGLVTPESKNVINIGWIPICEKFHRGHPEAARCCKESNQKLQAALCPHQVAAEKCGNGLWDVAMPIMVDSQHFATLFLGQFFYDDEDLDFGFFREQAKKYGYPLEKYMQAVEQVPCVSREQAEHHINYAAGLVGLLAELGYKNLQLAEEVQERRMAEHALYEGEQQYKALVGNVPGAVYQCLNDDAYSTIFISDAIEEFTGFNAKVMISEAMSIADIIHPDDLPCVQKMVDKAVSRREPYLLNYRMQSRDGSYTWVEERGQGVWDETGELRFLQGVIFDISERRRIEEEKRRLDEQLARAHKLESLGVLAGGIAHDFNNLLMAILGHADMLSEEARPGTATYESVNAIIQASQRAANLTRQMLAYSGKGHFMVEPVDLSAFVRGLAPYFEGMFPDQYRFNYILPEGLPAVCADVQQIKQLLTNLVTNAIESYGEASGEITIQTGMGQCDGTLMDIAFHNELQGASDYVFLEVTDSGCGMTEDTRRRLCDPFFSTKFTGRGLGMAAVLGIVRGHKGLLSVKSAPMKGTVIQALFPPFVRSQAQPSAAELPQSGTSDGLILLVDDEHIVRSVATKMLERAGFKVLVAQSGWEAVQFVEQQADEIACIILDLTMPTMDGTKTLAAIRQRNTHIPVILSSGYGEEEAKSRLHDHDVASFLQKPYKASALVDTLHRVLQ
jgi:PAS domain S-box-containing protein